MTAAKRIALMLVIGVLAAGLTLALAACGEGDDDNGDNGGAGVEEPTEAMDGEMGDHDAEDAQEVTVTTSDQFAFDPSEITVTAGHPVHLTLDNSGAALLHDWNIDDIPVEHVAVDGVAHEHEGDGDMEPALHVAADAGDTATIEFTPLEAGEYAFYCTVPGHREAGMEGTLIVEEE